MNNTCEGIMIGEKILELVARIERVRREKKYEEMQITVDTFLAALGDDDSFEAWKERAKVSYERHMAEWQKYKDDQFIRLYLDSSFRFAEQSSAAAKRAGDLAGELFPQQNIGGFILPALGRWEEGVALLKATLEKTESAIPTVPPEDVPRFSRIAMNCRLHLIDLAIVHRSSCDEVRQLFDGVKINLVFLMECEKNETWGREWWEKALGYLSPP